MARLLPPLHTSDAIVCALVALQSPVRWKTMQTLSALLCNQSAGKKKADPDISAVTEIIGSLSNQK